MSATAPADPPRSGTPPRGPLAALPVQLAMAVALAALLSSLLAVVYVWRIVEALYFGEPTGRAAEATEAPLTLLAPTWLMIGGAILFGIITDTTVGVARQAAEHLIGGM